ncbi:MAG: FUSC family protein [Pedobacter sp.]|nr:FUSC family protein [Pedobacter sp.]
MNRVGSIRSLLIEFFYGEYFKDALRNTFCVIFPIGLFFFLGYPQAAIGTGLGALVISLTDLPGNRTAKLKTAVLSVSLFFLTTFLVGLSFYSQWLTVIVIFLMAFVFAMMSAIGLRESVVGTMCIILAVFVLGLHTGNNLLFSLMVMTGGAWYYAISLIQTAILPFRSTHQAIHECLSATASFLLTKAKFYDPSTDLQECYKETIFQHQQVFEKQELIRNLLLTDRHAMESTNAKGRRLLNIVNSTFSLYEQVTAIHYNYDDLRKRFAGTSVLETVIVLIEFLASDLNKLSVSYLQRSKRSITADKNYAALLQNLQDIAINFEAADRETLLNIKLNLKQVSEYIHQVNNNEDQFSRINFSDFVPVPATFKTLLSHLSLSSPIARFSLRLALLCLSACLISYAFPNAKYSYWVLLTVVVIAKPRFSVSWNRNLQRLTGTFAGIVVGMIMLLLIKNPVILLILSSLFLIGFFTFNRPRYALSVFFITPCALIALSVLQGYSTEILIERSIFTIIGCTIAFAAAYIFPIWESNSIKPALARLLAGNYQYLETIVATKVGMGGLQISPKLARKLADNSLASFSETIQHLLQEPQIKHINIQMLYEIQVISYRINGMTTALNLSSTSGNMEMMQPFFKQALENIDFAIRNALSFDPGNMECVAPKGLENNKNLAETITALSLQLRAVITNC